MARPTRNALAKAAIAASLAVLAVSAGLAWTVARRAPASGTAAITSLEAGLDPPVRCLAQAIYFEARGEPFEGQMAVAQVVLNRVADPRYPGEICAVVFQHANRRHRCQFSFACDGKSDRARDRRAWQSAVRLARLILIGPLRDLTAASTHYHADYVAPNWAGQLDRTVKIGRHQFYREDRH